MPRNVCARVDIIVKLYNLPCQRGEVVNHVHLSQFSDAPCERVNQLAATHAVEGLTMPVVELGPLLELAAAIVIAVGVSSAFAGIIGVAHLSSFPLRAASICMPAASRAARA